MTSLPVGLVFLLLTIGAFAIGASAQAPPSVLDALDRQALAVDADAERIFRAAAAKLPEAVHFQKVRALTEQILKAKGLTLEQARVLLREPK